jgi:hypothetical protein
MKATYINRMGDDIQFELISEDEIKMSGFDYYRTGFNEDKTINFIDPSGGPYICIGTDMNRYFDGKFGCETKITSIQQNENGIILKVS